MVSLEYFAGLFDGEGCLSLSSKGGEGYYEVGITVTNTSLPVLLELREQYGGTVTTLKRYARQHRPVHTWELSARPAEGLIRQLLPHFHIKQHEATAWLQFVDIRRACNLQRKARPRPGRIPSPYTQEEWQTIEHARGNVLAFRTAHRNRKERVA